MNYIYFCAYIGSMPDFIQKMQRSIFPNETSLNSLQISYLYSLSLACNPFQLFFPSWNTKHDRIKMKKINMNEQLMYSEAVFQVKKKFSSVS